MKTLVVFYSRSGRTRKVAQALSERLQADVEEIQDTRKRTGLLGFLVSGFEAVRKKPATIVPIEKDPRGYDLVVVGTPVWASNMSSPGRAYLAQNRTGLPQAAFFCTCGGPGNEHVLAEMEDLAGKQALARLVLTEADLKSDAYLDQISAFVQELAG